MPTVTSENKAEHDREFMEKRGQLTKSQVNSDIEEAKSLVGEHGVKYKTQGGHIDVKHSDTKHAPRSQSIVDFVVDEKARGKGIGSKLLKHALSKHNDIGAQVSSPASVKVFHKHGFRHPEMPKGSFEEHLAKMKEDSSVFMAHKDVNGKPYVK
jgi:GNAT superfamily N-acetyltransferase